MKALRVINILLIFAVLIVWLIMLILGIENLPINILLAILLTSNLIILHLKVINRNINGEFVICRKRASVNWLYVVFAFLFLINPLTRFFGVAVIVVSVVIYLLYYFKKPIGIVIEDNQLLLNNLYLESGNLQEIRSVQLNGFLNRITIHFFNDRPLRIEKNSFDNQMIAKFLDLLLQKNPDIEFSENLREVFEFKAAIQQEKKKKNELKN